MARPLVLQDFASRAAEVEKEASELDRRLRAAWEEGHAQGVAEGTDAAARTHAESQTQLRAALIEALRDAAVTQQAAQAAVLAGIAPAVAQVVRELAPRLARAGVEERVAEALETALAERPAPAPVLRCAKEDAAGLEAALAHLDGAWRIEVDPRFCPLEAELHWDEGFDRIDLAAAVRALDAALDELCDGPAEAREHG